MAREKIVWCWWDRGDSEDGLVGFHTAKDRDRFVEGKPGPFRRRVSPFGKTISQTETWREMLDNMCAELPKECKP